jgi:hypothetical protein
MNDTNPLTQCAIDKDAPIITPGQWPIIMHLDPYDRQVGKICLVDKPEFGFLPYNHKDEPVGVPVPTFYEARHIILNALDPDYLPWERSNSFEENENDQEDTVKENNSRFLLKSSCVLEGSIYNVNHNQDWLCLDELSDEETITAVDLNNNMDTKNKKEGAEKSTEKKSKSPTLTCIVTGVSRPTTDQYLADKAKRLGCDVPMLHKMYVRKDVTKLFNAGKNQDEIRAALSVPDTHPRISDKRFKEAMAYNGKRKAEQPEKAEKASTKGSKPKSEKQVDNGPVAQEEQALSDAENQPAPATAEQAA